MVPPADPIIAKVPQRETATLNYKDIRKTILNTEIFAYLDFSSIAGFERPTPGFLSAPEPCPGIFVSTMASHYTFPARLARIVCSCCLGIRPDGAGSRGSHPTIAVQGAGDTGDFRCPEVGLQISMRDISIAAGCTLSFQFVLNGSLGNLGVLTILPYTETPEAAILASAQQPLPTEFRAIRP